MASRTTYRPSIACFAVEECADYGVGMTLKTFTSKSALDRAMEGGLRAAELPTPLDRPAGSENDKAGTGKAFGGGVANPQDAPVTMTVPDFSAGCCCLIGFY
ncbi:hypothetical protein C8J34_103118 [Rhizobium sp. PP-F2F-G36]|nr:hypothetical protein C8J34_103118 [Rhizobium sp. PP-F2F-G36]